MTKKILFICLILLGSTHTLAAGKISMLRGEATVIRATTKLAAKMQMPIKAKDVIETKKKGKLQLTFKDKTVVTIGANTRFSVEDYLFEDKKSKAKFNVKGGSFKVITGKIGKLAPKSFLLKTKTSLIGIRGTVFSGQVGTNKGNNDGDYIGCMQGSITVASIKTGEQKEIKNGQMLFVDEDGKLGKVEKLNEENFNRLTRLDGDVKSRDKKDNKDRDSDGKDEDDDDSDDSDNSDDSDDNNDNDNDSDDKDSDSSDLSNFEVDKEEKEQGNLKRLKPDINTLISEKAKVTYKGDLEGHSNSTMKEISKNRVSQAKAKIKADMKMDIDFGANDPLKVTISNQKLTLEEASVNGTALTGTDFENAKQSLSGNNSLTPELEMNQTLDSSALTIKGEYNKTANGLTQETKLEGKFDDKYAKELEGKITEKVTGTKDGVEVNKQIKADFDLEQQP